MLKLASSLHLSAFLQPNQNGAQHHRSVGRRNAFDQLRAMLLRGQRQKHLSEAR